MIDEKALIKTLNGIEEVLEAGTMKNTIGCVIGTIQEQPQVNEWIPIEERLPEDGDYLCSFDDGFVARVSFVYGDWELWADSGDVIAWQPLPKPYVKE